MLQHYVAILAYLQQYERFILNINYTIYTILLGKMLKIEVRYGLLNVTYGVLGQAWYLIVPISDLCLIPYF